MTAMQKLADNPIAHLSAEDIQAIGEELNAIRQSVLDTRGERDAAYIRKVIKAHRYLEVGSRVVLLGSLFPPAFAVGTLGLTVAKILDNMEIGHNILHGQWDWMRDPKIHSTTWEWDHTCPADQWKHSHNEVHHMYTNVLGEDHDLGYALFRADEDQPWYPYYLAQPLWNAIAACFFEQAIAMHDIDLAKQLKTPKDKRDPEFEPKLKASLAKIKRQALKDYIIHPILSGPSAPTTLLANFLANIGRNVWTHSVIMCGHFPEGVAVFEKASIEGETKAEWYLRQMLGSANITGGKAFHLMTGNLSFQIEHHIFPDLPSNRYKEVAPQVQAVFEKYGLPYVTGPFHRQLGSAWKKVVRLSLPNGFIASTTPKNAPKRMAQLYKMSTGGGKVRRQIGAQIEAEAA